MSSIVLSLFLIFLICLSGLLSASETALFSLPPVTLKIYRTSKEFHQRLVAQLMDHPRDVLVTILILNVVSNLLIQNTVSSIFDQFSAWTIKVGVPLSLILIFGEVIPKSIALPNNARIASLAAPEIHFLMRLLKPLRAVFNVLASFFSRIIFFFLHKEEEITPDELRHVLKTSLKSGVLNAQESKLVEGALDLKEATVKELMRPRDEVLFYDIQEPLTQLIHLFVDQQCTRVPICDGQLDQLLGILSTRRFFFHQNNIKSGQDLRPVLKKPFFVPESTHGWALLQTLRESKESMAIVVDEYGAIAGLITQEDLIESVVGEIADRRDQKNLFTRSGTDVIIASGKLELSEFEEIFGKKLISHENVVTLGGWLIEQLEDIPAAGTKYATDDFLFYVLAADPNRIRRIYVRYIRKPKKRGARSR